MAGIGISARPFALLALVGLMTALISCQGVEDPRPTPISGDGLQLLNATSGSLDVVVDGTTRAAALKASLASDVIALAPGVHTVVLRASGAVAAQFSVTTAVGANRSAVAYETGGGIAAGVLPDTGAVVPAGKSKVRVVNLAQNSSIDIWRTQPDFQTGIRFQFPFPYNPEPGPYFQSDAGEWSVWITPTSDWSQRLSELTLNVPSGERRTIAVVDSAGVLRLRVLVE